MTYSLKWNESVEKRVKISIADQLEGAKTCLDSIQTTHKNRYHKARKKLKKARAALRLIREQIGEDSFKKENAAYRDIARVCSIARDAQVMPETLERLLGHFEGQVSTQAFQSVRRRVVNLNRDVLQEKIEDKPAMSGALTELCRSLTRLRKLSFEQDGWKAIQPGFLKTYENGRTSCYAVYKRPSDVAFHEWRKEVKYLRHQLEMIESIWEKPLRELCAQLHELGNILGNDHDLVMLRETVEKDAKSFGEPKTVQALYALIERRQEDLRLSAETLGKRVYAEKPKAFIKRLHEYWRTWRKPPQTRSAIQHLVRPNQPDAML